MRVHDTFECEMCGQCCANQDLVQLTTFELYRLAEHLGMSPVEFFNEYCELGATNLNPEVHMYIRTIDHACPFLKDGLCSVHGARPFACRAYPMRAYRTKVSDMKAFVHEKYPMLESTCGLNKLDNDDVLLGDLELLIDQTISYWVDDAYYNLISTEGAVDMSIPYSAAQHYMDDTAVRGIAKKYLEDPGDVFAQLNTEILYSRIAMSLQALVWGSGISILDPPSHMSVGEGGCMGKYLVLKTNVDAYTALRSLVESGNMDVARTFAISLKILPDIYLINALHGSSAGKAVIGFQFEVDKETLEKVTQNGTMPLYVFFLPENSEETQAVGFSLSVNV
ncbi:YkgJ family cysteine cluster protein [Methanocella sp. CWC-04]|uniref:YkgJ family cysteine cluster protein n=1 Tax=Methanooceanicella nereidis TaxID=2052831 RepID=A0AAP2W4C1_9EURY|nr:YkgJ family cysteine cluster protein [Methanocella sp. CWC-04]MCD1294075.1 YkgJ family cysteine cluster protein [Methanocella sp. CWC-04]